MPVFRAWKLALTLLLTAVMTGLLIGHVQGVNGPDYWLWAWRRLPFFPLYFAVVIAVIPFFIAQVVHERRRLIAIGLLALTTLLLQILIMWVQPPGRLQWMIDIVENPNANYYYDARALAVKTDIPAREWLADYPHVLPLFHVHGRYKPPGLILFYFGLVQLFGAGHASAAAGGLIIALLASTAAPATYLMLKTLGRDNPDAAFFGASYMALCPSLILFWPQFDQVYVPLGCVLIWLWHQSLHTRRIHYPIAFGLMLALASFASYTILTLGIVLALQTFLFIADTHAKSLPWLFAACGLTLLSLCIPYYLLYLTTSFDPIATYLQITRSLANDMVGLARPFPRHLIFDVLDYLMGLGYIGGLLVLFALASMHFRIFRIFSQNPWERLAFYALIQFVVVLFTALLPGETARTWMLYMPITMAPIGWELSHWPNWARNLTYACLCLLLAAISQNMKFF